MHAAYKYVQAHTHKYINIDVYNDAFVFAVNIAHSNCLLIFVQFHGYIL